MKKIFVIAIGMIAASSASFAQSSDFASTTATLVTPISIAKSTDMNFGTVAASGTAGSIDLDYNNAVTAVNGAKVVDGTGATTAVFNVTGDGTSSFSIDIPTTITLASGSDELTVDGISCDAGTSSALEAGAKTIKVKATLQLPANAVAGTYANATDLTVTVNYN